MWRGVKITRKGLKIISLSNIAKLKCEHLQKIVWNVAFNAEFGKKRKKLILCYFHTSVNLWEYTTEYDKIYTNCVYTWILKIYSDSDQILVNPIKFEPAIESDFAITLMFFMEIR